MKTKYTVELSHYDYDAKETVQDGEVSVRAFAKAIDNAQFSELLDNFCNSYSSSFSAGREVGLQLRETHRTIQRSIIVELVGILSGLSEQTHSDARNAEAIRLAKKIAALYEEFGAGMMV